MHGLNAHTGKPLSGLDHLVQSVADILTTPIGTRIMRRDYGSQLPELIDQPHNGASLVRMYGAIATALQRWEPRLALVRMHITPDPTPGRATLELTAHVHQAQPGNTHLTIPLLFHSRPHEVSP